MINAAEELLQHDARLVVQCVTQRGLAASLAQINQVGAAWHLLQSFALVVDAWCDRCLFRSPEHQDAVEINGVERLRGGNRSASQYDGYGEGQGEGGEGEGEGEGEFHRRYSLAGDGGVTN